MSYFRKLYLFAVLLLIFYQPLAAQSDVKIKSTIDSIFSEWDNTDTPGAAVAVIKDGELVHSKGYGMADLEHAVPITPSTPFLIASLTKQFVAFSILLLEEERKLDLDAPIQEYLPDFPRYEDSITIRHMVHHTSGLRNYGDLLRFQGKSYYDHHSMDEVYALLKNQKGLNFRPGEEYLYNNSGYLLLTLIIEEVSGMSFNEFAAKNIFTPLGMNHTMIYDDITELIPDRAFSYTIGGDGFQNQISRVDLYGAGGMYSTIEDLYKWDQNFYENILGKGRASLIERMQETGILNNGDSLDYAFGLGVGTYKGLHRVGHGGSFAGFRHYFIRFPEQQFSVIMLTNREDAERPGKTLEVTDLLLKDDLKPVAEESDIYKQEIPSDDEETLKISAFPGRYLVNDRMSFEITLEDGHLIFITPTGSRLKMIRKKGNVFYPESNPDGEGITFSKPVQGKTQKVSFNDITAKRVNFEGSKDALSTFAGTYKSDELEVDYHLFVKNQTLMYRIGFQNAVPLVQVSNQMFTSDRPSFVFSRDKGGKLTGFNLNVGRTRDVFFQKQSNE